MSRWEPQNKAGLWYQLFDQLRVHLGDQLGDRLRYQARDQLWDQFGVQVRVHLRGPLEKRRAS